MQPVIPALDVTAEELEALLEGVREGLGPIPKTESHDPCPGYLAELLRERKITFEDVRELLLSGPRRALKRPVNG